MASPHRPSHIRRAAAVGTAVGLAILVLGALRLGLRLLAGRPGPTVSLRELALLPLMVAGFTLGGVVVAALTPLRRSRLGAALAGFIAALPVAAGAGLILRLAGDASGRSLLLGTLTWAAVFGPFAGMNWLRVDPLDDPIASAVPRLRAVVPPTAAQPEA